MTVIRLLMGLTIMIDVLASLKSMFCSLSKCSPLLGCTATILAGCTSGPVVIGRALTPAELAQEQSTESPATVLNNDPRFSDFGHVIDFAGLRHGLDDATDITIFAPTNAAFRNSDPDWGVYVNVGSAGSMAKLQKLVRASELPGLHPPDQFAGRLQDVVSFGGFTFHIDGRTPGMISFTTNPIGPADETGVEASVYPIKVAHLQLPPIRTAHALIYAVDNIIVH
jgi:hypothetical protein